MDERDEWRLYRDLAWLWPLWGDPDGEYRDWCAEVTSLIHRHRRREVRTLLNLGCGGGKNVWNLKREFEVTGLDISPAMLENARRLNPECEFVEDDMRTADIGRTFDAVLIDDAVSYMLSAADLRAVFATAYRHLEPGGVMVVAPDDTKETFRQNETYVSHAEGSTKPDDLEVVFVENNYDPDPDDETYEGTMVYLIREAGRLRIETDRHLHGLFPQAEWEAALAETGFEVHESGYTERRPGPDGTEREVTFATYACVRP